MITSIKHSLQKYLKGNQYEKNILILVGGRVLAQLLPILITPLLTRLYSPNDFGVFSVYLTIVAVLSMISNGRYCLAILLPEKDSDAQKLVAISSILSFLVSLIFMTGIMLKGEQIFALLNISILNEYKMLLGLNILFVALYEAVYYYALRKKKYKLIIRNVLIQAVILISIRIIGGYRGFLESGLMVSYFVGYVVAYLGILVSLRFNFNNKIGYQEFRNLLSKYIKFPKFSLFADLLGNLANMAPNIGVNTIFGSESAGYLAISDKVLGSPIWFVTSSVGDVFKQEAAEQYRKEGSCEQIFKKTSRDLFLLGFIPFLLIFILVPPAIPFLLGSEWLIVGDYIRIFSIMFFAKFVVSPISYVVYIVGKQNLNIVFQGLKFLAVIIAFVVGFYVQDVEIALIVWSLLTTVSYVIIYVISQNLANGNDKE